MPTRSVRRRLAVSWWFALATLAGCGGTGGSGDSGGGVVTYRVTYDANGATEGDVPVDAAAHASGQAVTVLGNTGGLARTGHAFAGWNTRAGGDGTTFTPGQTLTIGNADVTLFAVWTPSGPGTPRYADVIFAIDTSGSMGEEAAMVQSEVNEFANVIRAAGIDLTLVVIADPLEFCAPPPVGSGSCPADENLPAYRHVAAAIDSNDALDVVLSTYSQWSASLRADSRRTIIVVTDDDSDISASQFSTQLLALDPTMSGYHFNSVVATEDPLAAPPNSCSSIAGAMGSVYIELSSETGGIVVNLCEQNFTPGFSAMANAIVASFP